MSMDFVYDLTEKFQEQEIDYFVVTIRSGDKKNSADIFYHLKDEDSANTLILLLEKLIEDNETFKISENRDAPNKKKRKSPKKPKGQSGKKKGKGKDKE